MEQSRKDWLAERHEAQANYDYLPSAAELARYAQGTVIAIAVDDAVTDEAIKTALAGWAIEITDKPETHDRYIRATKKAK